MNIAIVGTNFIGDNFCRALDKVKGVKALAILLDEEGFPVVSMAMYPGELEVDLKEIKLLEEKTNASTTDESNNVSR